MNELIKPKALKSGDTIALISISGGRGGDADMIARFEEGKRRLESLYKVNVIATPNALQGNDNIYQHPEARGADLMWALKNKDINGIICIMGGDDSYRVFPFIDINVIHDNPKVFMGYSDIASWTTLFAVAGVMSYYGPNLLTPIAQPIKLDDYTMEAIKKCLFSTDTIGEIKPCDSYTKIEWRNVTEDEISWTKNTGYKLLQGRGKVQGRLFGGCGGPIRQIMGTEYFPTPEFFNDCILFFEVGSPYGSLLAGLHDLRELDAAGLFKNANGLITGHLNEEEEKMLLKFLKYEANREDLVVLENVDFAHRTPMTVIPVGAMAEIDCDRISFSIIESGVC
ncbi:S66 family peptidase [Lachnoclostridium phytofermentans]|uniref:Peptidase U61 LD-carboxypeptidase A n=1 Tax=Lachnoclostridium phytofermentans (strain ATCC 700394 / DSM 18823 / ISDg) TaxID=357809 RepID=A9KRQ1_LACP7|nr:S66 peptidase family protein [Lachnoclostridium phytofermentans]ABX43545.1 peptidase U61 LD-carboxypeptidase A [Lachnoclostridium phytofermentans ISDg]